MPRRRSFLDALSGPTPYQRAKQRRAWQNLKALGCLAFFGLMGVSWGVSKVLEAVRGPVTVQGPPQSLVSSTDLPGGTTLTQPQAQRPTPIPPSRARDCWDSSAAGWKQHPDECLRLLDAWQAEIDTSKPRPQARPGTFLSVDGWSLFINDDPKYARTVWNCPDWRGCGNAHIERVTAYADPTSGTWAKVTVDFKASGRGQPWRGSYNLDTGARQVNYSGRGNAGWTVYHRGVAIGGNTPESPKPKQKVTELK